MASGMNPLKEKWYGTPQNPKNIKSSNHLTLPNEMENLKLSSEMKLEEKGLKWDPSQLYIASRALNEKLPQHEPRPNIKN